MNRRWIIGVAIATAATFWPAQPASAQQQGSGALGNRNGSASSAGSASSLSAAQGFNLSSRFSQGGFDRFTGGSATMGQTTAGAQAATAGAFGQQAGGGANRFGGIGGIGGIGGLGGVGGLGGIGGMMGFGRNAFGRQSTQQSSQTKNRIRTRLLLGFKPRSVSSSVVNTHFGGILKRVLARDEFGGGEVTVAMDGRTAVLSGTVGSSHAREIAERLALLEPGIAEVRNELTVSPDEPTPETEPKSNSGDQPR